MWDNITLKFCIEIEVGRYFVAVSSDREGTIIQAKSHCFSPNRITPDLTPVIDQKLSAEYFVKTLILITFIIKHKR